MAPPAWFEPAESLCWPSVLCHAAAELWLQHEQLYGQIYDITGMRTLLELFWLQL